MNNKLVIIGGPTGVGKTEISLRLAEVLQGEIVSCDSMQIYSQMDIGSAKATSLEKKRIPHHMLDVVTPFDSFTVMDYKERAEKAIDDILSRGKIPIMVGGTGLYIDAVILDLSFTDGGQDLGFRDEMTAYAIKNGNLALHEKLKENDPEAAINIHPNNVKRVIRALEVFKLTGKPFSSFKDSGKLNPKYEPYYFYLNKDRNALYESIDERVEKMMDAGLLAEIKNLADQGLNQSYMSMQGIGYKEMLSYVQGDLTLDEAKNLVKKRSRNYAKRQLTWFRHHSYAKELSKNTLNDDEIIDHIIKALSSSAF